MGASEITTVIPYFNGSNTLDECLTSIANELLPPREVIIVNDGSNVAEVAKLGEIISRHNQIDIRVIHQENSGQGGARNKGVQCSETKYVAFLDQDDRVHPCHNKILYSAIVKAKEYKPLTLYASGDVRQINEHSEVVCNLVCRRSRRHSLDDAMALVSNDLFILPGATLVDRSLFLKTGGFDAQLKGYEDDDFFLRAYRSGYEAILLDDEVTDWRIHSSSTSYSMAMMKSRFLYYCKLLDSFPDDPFQSRFYSQAIDRRFRYWFRHDYLKALAAVKVDISEEARQRLLVATQIMDDANEIRRTRVYAPPAAHKLLARIFPRLFSISRLRVLNALRFSYPRKAIEMVQRLLGPWH